MQHGGWRRLAVGAGTGLAAMAVASGSASAAGPPALTGYTPAGAARQARAEAALQRTIDPGSLGEISRALSARTHLVGSEGSRRVWKASLARLRSYGLQTGSASYDVAITKLRKVSVTMTAPTTRRLATRERNGFPWQRDVQNIVDGYNAYTPSGDVTAPIVYANYGRPEDFAALDALGVSVKGKLVLTRYGKNFRGVKTRQAELRGAAGVIIYSDPADDGFVKGPVYPNGPFRPADAIQRGSIQYLWDYPGDPLTPGRPSLPGTPRLDPAAATDLPRIPTTPISYSEAEPLLRALTGPVAPAEFQGGLGFPYHVGPGPTTVHLDLDVDLAPAPVRDAFGYVRGAEHPDELVIVGAHHDAWTFGANDDVSGWASVLELGKRLGALTRRGWRPDRTIVLAGWDGEEYGLLGSTEWTEQYERQLRAKAVGYLNVDVTAGRTFGAGAVPAFDGLLTDVAATVAQPGATGSVLDAWRAGESAGEVERLGSGSDYTALLDHVGVPALEVGFTSPSGEYHSAYDDSYQVEHNLDPGYLGQAAAARVLGVAATRLADADVLPLRYSAYAAAVQTYVADLVKVQGSEPGAAQVDLSPIAAAAQRWQAATTALEARADALVASNRVSRHALARVNRALRRQERALTDPRGLPSRPWYRHLVYAPGVTTGYASQQLPGIRDALDAGDVAGTTQGRDRLVAALDTATAIAERAAR